MWRRQGRRASGARRGRGGEGSCGGSGGSRVGRGCRSRFAAWRSRKRRASRVPPWLAPHCCCGGAAACECGGSEGASTRKLATLGCRDDTQQRKSRGDGLRQD
ncbi:hypothetical protein BDA96_03G250000 [Sorghum bicolor]|uniref:Uncharacterized protein n=2 Tax=Sorghum bicolor TaxID=4558 RepID=A0A921RFF6_SORBI|nr:hypothetical protein BDA96_03G250000 [Sorghum bicolor]KXG32948.1 hypothetical protein SORBI_3003G230800 [Sorghum bicolor]